MSENAVLGKKNVKTSLWLAGVVIGMFGFGYALIPLYNVFCEITGINGKGLPVAIVGDMGDGIDRGRLVTIEFTGSIMGGLPWQMTPAKTMKVHPGETVRITYSASNLADREVVGQAVPSVSPPRATKHFVKTECFCFTNQTLAPGETRQMPLIFRVDTNLPDQVKTITLSYAFYGAQETAAAAAEASGTSG